MSLSPAAFNAGVQGASGLDQAIVADIFDSAALASCNAICSY